MISYSVAIDAFQKSSQWSTTLAVLRLMSQRTVAPDVYSFSSAIKSCATCGQWQLALVLMQNMQKCRIHPNEVTYASFIGSVSKHSQWKLALETLFEMQSRKQPPDNFCCTAAVNACTKATRWQAGLEVFQFMCKQRLNINQASMNTVISAFGQGSLWQEASGLLRMMGSRRIAPDLITYNSVIETLAAGGRWKDTMEVLRRLDFLSLHPTEVSFTSTCSAFKTSGDWQAAVAIVAGMCHTALRRNEVSFGAGISLYEKVGQWSRAFRLFAEMLTEELQPDVVSTNSAISACEVSGNLDLGISLLIDSELKGQSRPPSSFLWALARLGITDPVIIHSALLEAFCTLQTDSNQGAQQVVTMWWAIQMLGAANRLFTSLLTARSLTLLHDFTSEELLMLLWGSAGHAEHSLCKLVQQEWIDRITRILSRRTFPMDVWRNLRSHMLGSMWACTYAGMGSQEFRLIVKEVMLVAGCTLDELSMHTSIPVKSQRVEHGTEPGTFQHILEPKDVPVILFDVPDLLVVLKPPGWEVERRCQDGETSYRSLCSLLASQNHAPPIFSDADATFGFLHRLDVPSSGLVLAARTYQAYYALNVQLAAGQILRDYNVLSHGWICRKRAEINAGVYWRGGSLSRSSGQGKPSRSYLKPILLGYLGYDKYAFVSATLVAIRIATGRRHQIRSHLAHIGHPVCRDDIYASQGTASSDRHWCPRNALHRYRIRFGDVRDLEHDVVSPLPSDLVDVIGQIVTKTARDAEAEPVHLQQWCDFAFSTNSS